MSEYESKMAAIRRGYGYEVKLGILCGFIFAINQIRAISVPGYLYSKFWYRIEFWKTNGTLFVV